MAEQGSSKRQVAYKVYIADILNNRYVKEEGWLPNYIAVGDKKVSRANLLGVIVSKDTQETDVVSQNFILDDGTGRVALRFFESGADLDVGDMVTVIGRPREFGAERYVVPEVIKKVKDPRWVQFRKLELAGEKRPEQEHSQAPEELSVETEDFVDDSNPLSDIMSIIRRLDVGAGVEFSDISKESGKPNTEELVNKLLEQGDIFEVKPGRYKVLE
jgi:RPA family protein